MRKQNIKIILMLALLIASQSSLVTANDDPMSVRKKSKSKVETTTNEKQKQLEDIIKNGNGMVIAPNPNAVEEEKATEEPQYIIHTVKSGESLSILAGKYLGDIHRWKELVELNKDAYPSLAKNPNLIHPNWKIKVPVEKKDEIATDTTKLDDKKATDTKRVDNKTDDKSNVEVTDVSRDSDKVNKSLIPNWTTKAKIAKLQSCVDSANRARLRGKIEKLE